MKHFHLIVLLACLLCFACNQKPPKNHNARTAVTLPEGLRPQDTTEFINVFRSFLQGPRKNIDSLAKISAAFTSATGEQLSQQQMKEYLTGITAHVDSVMCLCIDMTLSGDYNNLMDVLEQERVNVFEHPACTTEGILMYDAVLMTLYQTLLDTNGQPSEEHKQKTLHLYETEEVLLALRMYMDNGTDDMEYVMDEYGQILNDLLNVYRQMGNKEKAIFTANKINDFNELRFGRDDELYTQSIKQLGDIYGEYQMTAQRDSCYRIYDKLSGTK
ncbi:MAG: hypothetical protein IJ632_03310 [Muribaculaceae bacterium]|nr:hypothetical protein [Muribaculaceae bacterium]